MNNGYAHASALINHLQYHRIVIFLRKRMCLFQGTNHLVLSCPNSYFNETFLHLVLIGGQYSTTFRRTYQVQPVIHIADNRHNSIRSGSHNGIYLILPCHLQHLLFIKRIRIHPLRSRGITRIIAWNTTYYRVVPHLYGFFDKWQIVITAS